MKAIFLSLCVLQGALAVGNVLLSFWMASLGWWPFSIIHAIAAVFCGVLSVAAGQMFLRARRAA